MMKRFKYLCALQKTPLILLLLLGKGRASPLTALRLRRIFSAGARGPNDVVIKRRFLSVLLLPALLYLFSINISAQNLIQNGTFFSNYTGAGITPEDWGVCDPITSSPEVYIEFIRQDVSYFSPDSSTFVILRVREDATSEHMQTLLTRPMLKDYCYKLSVDLRHTYGGTLADILTHPVLFQIWGGITPCSKDELLYESQLIRNFSWQRYSFTFPVKENDYP